MEIQLLRSINGNGCLSFKEIYRKSKKYEDYESRSTMRTVKLCFDICIFGKFLDTKADIEMSCRYLWCGVKVAFYLDPSSDMLQMILKYITEMFSLGNREFITQFKQMRDYDILNYKNPFEDQAKVISVLNDLLRRT